MVSQNVDISAGEIEISMPRGTEALSSQGTPLESMNVQTIDEPSAPPSNWYMIGHGFNLQPEGATFVPPLPLTLKYDLALLPEGAAENDLFTAYFDSGRGQWVRIQSTVDTTTHTISAQVSRFALFAIFPGVETPPYLSMGNLTINPAEVAPGDSVNISANVHNSGAVGSIYIVTLKIDGAEKGEQDVTVAGGGTESVSFSVSEQKAGKHTVEMGRLTGDFIVTKQGAAMSWSIIGAVIIGVIILVLICIWIFVRRYPKREAR